MASSVSATGFGGWPACHPMATFRTVRAMKVSSPLGWGRALTPATTKYAPARIPNVTATTSARTMSSQIERLFMAPSLFRRHHRQAHGGIGEELVSVLHRTKVVGLPLIRRLCGVLRVNPWGAGQLHGIKRRLNHHHRLTSRRL